MQGMVVPPSPRLFRVRLSEVSSSGPRMNSHRGVDPAVPRREPRELGGCIRSFSQVAFPSVIFATITSSGEILGGTLRAVICVPVSRLSLNESYSIRNIGPHAGFCPWENFTVAVAVWGIETFISNGSLPCPGGVFSSVAAKTCAHLTPISITIP